MKKVIIAGEGMCEIVEAPTPAPRVDWALVKVLVAPMCTEYKAFKRGDKPLILGHEAAGEVAAIAQPGRVTVGDRVVVMPLYPCGHCPLCIKGEYIYCSSGADMAAFAAEEEGMTTYAQYVLKPDRLLVPVPGDISLEHASMACCGLGPTFGACERMHVGPFDAVLITGLGPVGLGGVINVLYRGGRVIAVDSNPYRLDLARQLGADAVLDASEEGLADRIVSLTSGAGASKAIDCSGVPLAQRLCVDVLARCGQLTFVGEGGDFTVAISNDLIRKGLTLHGQWHYNLEHTTRIMQMIRDCASQLDVLITGIFPMSRAQEAFELQVSGRCGKVVLKPWE